MKTLMEILNDNPDLTWTQNPGVGTDKGGLSSDEHDYVRSFYEEGFAKYQDKNIDLLEIGVYHGASLALWSLYFPNANIIGLDIDDQVAEEYQNLDRVKIGICDAYSPEIADSLGNFDIIIDDGPHTLPTVQKCIELYLPKLNKGGVMVLEDIQDLSWIEELEPLVPEGYQTELIDVRNNLGRYRYDDLIYVIKY
jgi:predicted O-methyltransferase YrrM